MKTIEEKVEFLRSIGFVIGSRDPLINTDFEGTYMVTETYDASELPTKDASNGPWAIVGNNLETLVNEAYEIWAD